MQSRGEQEIESLTPEDADEMRASTEPRASRVGSILPPPMSTAMPVVREADLEDTGPLSMSSPPSGQRLIRRRGTTPATIPPPSDRLSRTSRPLPSVPPCAANDQELKDLLVAPKSDRAPVSTWRPKQKYPSYAPAPAAAAATPEPRGRAFAIKVLDSPAEARERVPPPLPSIRRDPLPAAPEPFPARDRRIRQLFHPLRCDLDQHRRVGRHAAPHRQPPRALLHAPHAAHPRGERRPGAASDRRSPPCPSDALDDLRDGTKDAGRLQHR